MGRAPTSRGLGAGLGARARGLRERVLPGVAEGILHGHEGRVRCVAADAELDVVVSGGEGECLLHSLSKGRYIRALAHPQRRPVAQVRQRRCCLRVL